MIIYTAGTPAFQGGLNDPKNKRVHTFFQGRDRLLSYYYSLSGMGKDWFEYCTNKNNNVRLFLDSGAFSAWAQGATINIQDYINFIKQYEDSMYIYANLDVIGIGGKQPNRLTAEKTLENQHIMEKEGILPVPVFHYGEPFEFLQHYVENYDYLALGVAGNKGAKIVPWLDVCFRDYICDKEGFPKIKTHGFAVTSVVNMFRYPWYSVDSTSWILTAANGSIYVPRFKDGEYRYDLNSWKIAVSNRSPSKSVAGEHISTIPPRQKQVILEYIHSKGYSMGKSSFKRYPQNRELKNNERWAEKKPKNSTTKRLVEAIVEPGLSNDYYLRSELNIIYFQDLAATIPEYPWAFKHMKQGGRLF